MWDWLEGLSGGAANFAGSFTGASVGLVAILIGALVNAHLNRRRDDRLLGADRAATAAALRAELLKVQRMLIGNAEKLEKIDTADFRGSDLNRVVRLLPHMLPKLGLFDATTIQAVVGAYGLIEEHTERIIYMGGTAHAIHADRYVVQIPSQRASAVATMNRNFAEKLNGAIDLLGQYHP